MYVGNQLARIHIGKKALGWDDETYRDWLALNFNGKRSAKDLTLAERAMAIVKLEKLGAFKPKPLTRQQKACVAKWYELRRMGVVKSKDKSSLNRFTKKHLGVWSISDLTDAQTDKLYSMLESWIEKEKLNQTQLGQEG